MFLRKSVICVPAAILMNSTQKVRSLRVVSSMIERICDCQACMHRPKSQLSTECPVLIELLDGTRKTYNMTTNYSTVQYRTKKGHILHAVTPCQRLVKMTPGQNILVFGIV
jgi:hypothetical protein